MAQKPETGAININLNQFLMSISTLLYSKPETDMPVTEMTTYN